MQRKADARGSATSSLAQAMESLRDVGDLRLPSTPVSFIQSASKIRFLRPSRPEYKDFGLVDVRVSPEWHPKLGSLGGGAIPGGLAAWIDP